ncbi:MAG TPA: hypothetical protein VM282_13195 [Acidimicrobiales bacterium]|nr:hypothetical protein [Acidimicrobiales bacterium]
MLRGSEEGGEAGVRVEARQAQPIDGPVPADQGRSLRVAHKGVILDAHRVAICCGQVTLLRLRTTAAGTFRYPRPVQANPSTIVATSSTAVAGHSDMPVEITQFNA